MLDFSNIKKSPQLDIVGIVAVLGEGSTARNSQASALGWHHILPRLLPAPQALLKHEQEKRLPTVPGTVVGAYSGNVKFELNFFCQLLHDDKLGRNQVQLVEVSLRTEPIHGTPYMKVRKWFRQRKWSRNKNTDKTPDDDEDLGSQDQAYDVKKVGALVLLSVLGCGMSIAMVAMSVHYKDGFAFLATVFLSFTSSFAGFASWGRLNFHEDPPKARSRQDRKHLIPDSDVVIYYPTQGAFRIVRCTEATSRLYFKTETFQYTLKDNPYRVLALFASVLLMAGLLCMGNSSLRMQIVFAAFYIVLNALYWAFSALNPVGRKWGHWKTKYDCKQTSVVLASSGPNAPARSGTVESYPTPSTDHAMNTESVVSTGNDAQTTQSPTSIKFADTAFPDGNSAPNVVDIRQRKVTFHEDVSSASSVHKLQKIGTKHPVDNSNQGTTPLAPATSLSKSPADNKNGAKTNGRRQNTYDSEGLKPRLSKPFGSLRDTAMNWLVEDRKIHKMPPQSVIVATGNEETEAATTVDDEDAGTFTAALWKAIAVTGSTRWLRQTHIAPDNAVWEGWIEEAGKRAASYKNEKGVRRAAFKEFNGKIMVPSWDYQGDLSERFRKEQEADLDHVNDLRRPPTPETLKPLAMEKRVRCKDLKRFKRPKGISDLVEYKLRKLAHGARLRVARRRLQRISTMPRLDEHQPYNASNTDHAMRDAYRSRPAPTWN